MRFPCARRQAFACLALLVLSSCSWAEPAGPLSNEATTSVLNDQSPLKAYQPFREPELNDWREANEQVGRIGGWRTYAIEPWEQPSNNAPAPSVMPMGDEPHGHH
jgi:hypothetical protein